MVGLVLGGRTRAPPDPPIYVGGRQPPHVNGGVWGLDLGRLVMDGKGQRMICHSRLNREMYGSKKSAQT